MKDGISDMGVINKANTNRDEEISAIYLYPHYQVQDPTFSSRPRYVA